MEPSNQTSPTVSPPDGALTDVLRQLTPRSHMLNSLQLIIDAHSLVSVTDRAGRIIYVNDRFCQVSKYSREELIGQTHRIVKSGHHPPAFYEDIWSTISSGKAWTGDIRNKANDGTLYWTQSSISPIFDEKNRIAGYGSIRTDVTAQRQLMAELEDNERRAHSVLSSAIEALDDGITISDKEGKIITSNKKRLEMYPEANDILGPGSNGIDGLKRIQPELSDDEARKMMEEFRTTETRTIRELTDGRTVRVTRKPTAEGGFVSLHTDITDLVRLQDNEQRAYATLKAAIDAIESSLMIVDAAGRIVNTNEAYSAMYPESADEEQPGNLVSAIVRKQRPWLSEDEVEEFVLEILSADSMEQCQLTDGRTVKIQRQIIPGGGFVSLHTDITDFIKQTEQLESQAAAMDLMKAIAVDANASTDIELAYTSCLERICKFTGWEVGHVYLPANDGTGRSSPASSWYCAEESKFAPFRKKTEHTIFGPGAGLPGRVFQSGDPAWVRDVTADPNFPRAAAAKESGIIGGAAFPVKIRDQVVAVLEFYATQPIEPNPQLEEILSHVCTQIGRVAERDRSEKTLMTRVTAELRKRDQELVEQNERFDAALKNMTQGLCMFDKEQRLIVSNDRYAQMYDLPPQLLKPGITLRQILEYRIAKGIYAENNPEEYIEERMEWVTSGVRTNKVQELSDGRSISITHQPMPDGGWVTTHEEITERRKAEKALQESQELSSKAFRTSPAAIAISNPADGSHFDVNETWTSMLGYSHEEAMKISSVDLGMWAIPGARSRFVGQLSAAGSVSDFETTFRTKDGRLLDVLVSGEQMETDGQPRLLVVSHDITERKKSEQALRESEQRFKDIVEVSSDWIWECDENLRYTYLSERFTQVTGQPKERFLGKTRQEIAHNSGPEWNAHLADIEAHRPFRGFTCNVTDENGEQHHWMINGLPLFDADGIFTGYRGTGADRTTEIEAEAELIRHRDHLQDLVNEATTELKERAEDLHQALAKEKELNELQRQFLSMASHEFRTPLAIIDSAAQRLLRRAKNLTPQDTVTRVEKIRGAVGRMTQLMESTLAAARLESGKPSIQLGACDIGTLLQEICGRQQEIARTHNISFIQDGLPDTIKADSAAIEQIFTNLLSNAVKYAPYSPDIDVRGRIKGDNIVITVQDSGLGIANEDLPKMFQRFFRAGTSTGIAGTGIGLNLVKTLVELHEGSIEVQSEKGSGSVFTVCLPIQGPAAVETAAGQAA